MLLILILHEIRITKISFLDIIRSLPIWQRYYLKAALALWSFRKDLYFVTLAFVLILPIPVFAVFILEPEYLAACCGDEWFTEELARRDTPQFTAE